MTASDEWAEQRAKSISARGRDPWGPIASALREAIERGKAEAVAAERERLGNWQQAAELWMGKCLAAEAKLARLKNPDEALVEAVAKAIYEADPEGGYYAADPSTHWRAHKDWEVCWEMWLDIGRAAVARLALTLTEGQDDTP